MYRQRQKKRTLLFLDNVPLGSHLRDLITNNTTVFSTKTVISVTIIWQRSFRQNDIRQLIFSHCKQQKGKRAEIRTMRDIRRNLKMEKFCISDFKVFLILHGDYDYSQSVQFIKHSIEQKCYFEKIQIVLYQNF